MSRRFVTNAMTARRPMAEHRRLWIHGPIQPMARPPHPGERAINWVALYAILLALATIVVPGAAWLLGGAG